MPRVKRGMAAKKRHKKLRKHVRGYLKGRQSSIKHATEARLHARSHARKHRRNKKRELRSLWVVRINNALRKFGNISYSAFMHQLELKNVGLDRKTLAYFADQAPEIFKAVIQFVMEKDERNKTN